MNNVIWQTADRYDNDFSDTQNIENVNGQQLRAVIYLPQGATGIIDFVLPSGKSEQWNVSDEATRQEFNALNFQTIRVNATNTTIPRASVKLYGMI